MARQVVFVSAVRTAIGSFGKSLRDVPATRLGTIVIEAAVNRANVDLSHVGHVVFGANRVTFISRVSQPSMRGYLTPFLA